MGWIYLRSLVLKEHRQSDANNDSNEFDFEEGGQNIVPLNINIKTMIFMLTMIIWIMLAMMRIIVEKV